MTAPPPEGQPEQLDPTVHVTLQAVEAPHEPDIVIGSREQLLYLLAEAAEIEHTLMCSYLYAAFSLKPATASGLLAREAEAVERWRQAIMGVAISESRPLLAIVAMPTRPLASSRRTPMPPRIDDHQAPPGAAKVMLDLQHDVDTCGLEPALLELVTRRASQIHGGAFCLDRHAKDARAMGETEPRPYALNAWPEAPFDTDCERAALAWTEAVTWVADGHVPDDVSAHARQHFSEQGLVNLTTAVVAINGWNRLAISCRWPAGGYWPERSRLT